jgi:Ca2+-binding RTX toxin-like protein
VDFPVTAYLFYLILKDGTTWQNEETAMAKFTGTGADETITTTFISPTVIAEGAIMPGNDPDTITGGGGDDTIAGGRGDDIAFMGLGNDTYIWNPGDGSDTVEGGRDSDLLDFNGANVSEKIDIAANGTRVRFSRDVAAITMDLNGIEQIAFNALGGSDTITINDLSGTGVKRVAVNLQAFGSDAGDGQADFVNVSGRTAADTLNIASTGSTVTVTGLPWRTEIGGAESIDSLMVFGQGGDDVIKAAGVAANAIALAIDAGSGDDSIVGSLNGDMIVGGTGRDHVAGGRGNDTISLGVASDIYFWRAGDGNDVVEGDLGNDMLDFTASSATEAIAVSAVAGRTLVQRGTLAGSVDMNNVERLFFHGTAATDNIAIGDLTGTSVKRIDIDLRAKDGVADFVTLAGAAGADNIALSAIKGGVAVNGLQETVFLRNAAVNDRLVFNGGLGADTIDASDIAAGSVRLSLNGGDDSDLILGSHGADSVAGNRGNDTAFLGDGNDRFIWNPGDGSDIVNGQAGTDTLDFFGANINEHIDLSANGARLRFSRDVAAIAMDTVNVEQVQFHAFGGADVITVNNLSGTSIKRVGIDLRANPAAPDGDGQSDQITVQGRQTADSFDISTVGSGIVIDGLPWKVVISAFETIDRLTILAGAGNDVIDASGVSGSSGLTIDSGLGNDTVTGGAGADVFIFSTALNAATNVDRITAFSVADDTISLGSAVFTGIGAVGPLAAAEFHVGTAAADADDRIIYDSATGKLFFDSDGTGANDAVLFARLQPGLSLTQDDFTIA